MDDHPDKSTQIPRIEIDESIPLNTIAVSDVEDETDLPKAKEQKQTIISGTSNEVFIRGSQNLKSSQDGTSRFWKICPRNLADLTTIIEKLYLAEITCLVMLWLSMYSIVGCSALPGGHLFALLVLVVCCIIGGKLIQLLKFPPLLGMLLVGFLLRNLPTVNVAVDLDPTWSSSLRSIALVVILIRAGLGLDPQALRRLSFVCFRLAFSPCIIETITVAISSHLLLNLPWLWGFMLGFVLSAVSPAVVVPSMIAIQEKGLGRAKGIPTLIIAAASVDDVLAISGFGIVLGIAFTQGSLVWTISKGPIEVIIGLAFGIILGITLWFVPSEFKENKEKYRFSLLFCGGIVAVFGSRLASFGGAGALGCLVFSFVAAYGWRRQGLTDDNNPVADMFASLWFVFQPILFGLIGAEITVAQLDPSTIGFGLAVLCIGMLFRLITSFIVVAGAGFTLQERLFVSLAWLPKATVQAAIGPVALDFARQKGDGELEQYGLQVLTISVLVILVTAPIGAAAISLSAPRLLSSSNDSEQVTFDPRCSGQKPPYVPILGNVFKFLKRCTDRSQIRCNTTSPIHSDPTYQSSSIYTQESCYNLGQGNRTNTKVTP